MIFDIHLIYDYLEALDRNDVVLALANQNVEQFNLSKLYVVV